MLTKLFRSRGGASRGVAELPPGERVYAIGDVHGRLDLLDALLAEVDADNVARSRATTTLVFLGDLIDRGPQSAELVERLRCLSAERPGTRFLLGTMRRFSSPRSTAASGRCADSAGSAGARRCRAMASTRTAMSG